LGAAPEEVACFAELIAYSERRTRAEIAKIPDGVYEHAEVILEDGAMGGPYTLRLKLTVKGDEIEFDYFVQGVRKGYTGFQVERERTFPISSNQ